MATIIVNPYYVAGGFSFLTGLVSWWDLTADGLDDQGGNNLSNRGSPTFGTVSGQDCVTTDSSNHLYIASPTGLALTTFTVACWVYETSTGAARMIAGCQEGPLAVDIRYVMRSANGSLQLIVSDGSTNQPLTGTAITANTWVPVVATFDGATGDASIWMNGTETSTSGLNPAVGSFGFGIGGNGGGGAGGSEFVGSIKSCGVWNYKWTATQVTAFTNGGTPLTFATL